MLFPPVLMNFPNSKVCLIGEWSIACNSESAIATSGSIPRKLKSYNLSSLFVDYDFHTFYKSEGSKSSTHYLNDKNRFDVSSKGPSSGISVGGGGGL